MVLLAVLGFLSFKVHGFYQNYLKKEHRTEIRMTDAINRTWPEVTVCSKAVKKELVPPPNLFYERYEFCYKNQSYYMGQREKVPCVEPGEYVYVMPDRQYHRSYPNITYRCRDP